MKLINKDITYLFGDELDDTLGHAYENERKYQGSKQHIRLRWSRGKVPNIEYWSDCGHSRHELYGLIDKFIRKRIGQKFDKVYSEFLKDPRFKDSNMSFTNRPRDIFKDYICIDERYHRIRSTWRDTYMVDSEGRIQLNPNRFIRKKNRNLVIRRPYEQREVRYKINHINVYRLRDAIILHWGWNRYFKLISNTYLTKEQYEGDFFKLIFDIKYSGHANAILAAAKEIEGCRQFLRRYWYICKNDLKELLFKEIYAPNEEYIRGTRGYYIKLAEIKQAERKADKARKHPDRSAYERTLKLYSNIHSNRRYKREQARSKQEDIKYS